MNDNDVEEYPTGDELDGYIYLIGCQQPLSVKIGFTKGDPRKRLKQLQTGSPTKLVLCGWYPGTQGQERELHQQLAKYNLTGEWFRLDRHDDELQDLLRGPVLCCRINNVLSGFDVHSLDDDAP